MTTVAVARFVPVILGPEADAPPRLGGSHPKMEIVAEGAAAFVVPFAPRDGTIDGIVPTFATVERGGRKSLLLRGGTPLATYDFDLILGYRDPQTSVKDQLGRLRKLAASGARMRIKFDTMSGDYVWRMTRFTANVVMRQHGTNEPTRVVISVGFTECSDPIKGVGPVSGGASGGGSSGPTRPAFYVIKKGDTLQSIAKKFYGYAHYWREIADANKIRHPKKIKVGQKIKLPAIKIFEDWQPLNGPR